MSGKALGILMRSPSCAPARGSQAVILPFGKGSETLYVYMRICTHSSIHICIYIIIYMMYIHRLHIILYIIYKYVCVYLYVYIYIYVCVCARAPKVCLYHTWAKHMSHVNSAQNTVSSLLMSWLIEVPIEDHSGPEVSAVEISYKLHCSH